MIRSRRGIVGLVLLTLVACDGSDPAGPAGSEEPSPPPPPTVASIELAPAEDTLLALGATLELDATARDSTGSPLPEATLEWASSDPSVAGVDQGGRVTAEGVGSAEVTASAGSVEASSRITVIQLPHALTVTPAADTLHALGQQLEVEAAVLDAGGSPIPDLSVAWSSSDTAVVRISSEGVATAAADGVATVTATHEELVGVAELTVAQRPAHLEVTPDTVLLVPGAARTLVYDVTDANGHRVEGVSPAWTSGAPGVATVDAGGVVRAVAEGATTVRASLGDLTDSVRVVVTPSAPPPEPSFDLEPDSLHFDAWGLRFAPTAWYDDGAGNRRQVTPRWGTGDSEVAASVSGGFVTYRDGATWVYGTYQGLRDSVRVSVERVPIAWEVSPSSMRLSIGQTDRAWARSVDRAGTEVQEPGTEWTPRDPSLIDFDVGFPTTGITGRSAGSTWMVVSWQDFADSIHIQVDAVVGGDVTIETQADVDAIEGIGRIGGSLRIVGSDLETLSGLHSLVQIDQDLEIRGNPSLRNLGDLSVQEVGGSLTVMDNPVLSDADLGALDRVNGLLRLENNPGLTVSPFTSLLQAGSIRLVGNAGTSDGAPFPTLFRASGSVDLGQGPTLRFPVLTELGGVLRMVGTALQELGMPELRTVGHVDIRGSGLQELVFPAATTTGMIRLHDNAALTRVELPVATEVRFLEFIDNTALTSIRIPGVARMSVTVGGSDQLEELALDALQLAGRFSISGGKLRSLVAPEIEKRDGFRPEVLVTHMPLLESLTVRAAVLETFNVIDAPLLRDLSMEQLEEITFSSYFSRLGSLTRFEAPNLTRAVNLVFQWNPVMETVSLPRLAYVRDAFISARNAVITSIETPALTFAGGIGIVLNPALKDLSALENVTSPVRTLQIVDNASLTSIAGLSRLGDDKGSDPIFIDPVLITGNGALPTSKIQELVDHLEAKYDGEAFANGVVVENNGGG